MSRAATTAQEDRQTDDRAHTQGLQTANYQGRTTNRVLGNTIRALKELQKVLTNASLQGGDDV